MGEAKMNANEVATGTKKACGNCKHYHRSDIHKGNCTESPPTMCMVVGPGGQLGKICGYPEVNFSGVPCSRHKPVFSLPAAG